MPIPDLDADTGYLPPGDHAATFAELRDRFGFNHRRRQILADLEWLVQRLRGYGVTEIFIDGGFVTAKERTRDVEVVYVAPPPLDPESWGRLAPSRRKELKKDFRIDLWLYPSIQPNGKSIKDFFSTDRENVPKGMIYLVEDFPPGEED